MNLFKKYIDRRAQELLKKQEEQRHMEEMLEEEKRYLGQWLLKKGLEL